MALVGQQISRAYGFNGYVNVFPKPLEATQAPTSGVNGDQALNGQLWVDTTNLQAYIMVNQVSNTWVLLEAAGGPGVFNTLTVDPGPIVINSTLTTITATANVADVFKLTTGGGAGTTSTFTITNITGTSVNAIHLDAQAGGIHLSSAVTTKIESSKNGADAIVIESTAGGTQILASNAVAGEDILIAATGSSVKITSSEAVGTAFEVDTTAGGMFLSALNESHFTVSAAGQDIFFGSLLGQAVINGGEAAANAIELTCLDLAGGIDINAGTGGLTIDTTGGFSIDGVGASNVTTTNNDLTLSSTAASIQIVAAEAVVDAIRVFASNAAGGIDVDAGTGGVTLDTTGAFSIDGVAASNVSTTTGDITISSSVASANVIGAEAVFDAVKISATSATGGILLDAGPTPGVTLTNGTQSAQILVGTGSPNTAVTAAQGSIFLNVAGGADTILYVNTNGATAWTPLTST